MQQEYLLIGIIILYGIFCIAGIAAANRSARKYRIDIENTFLETEVACNDERYFLERGMAILVHKFPRPEGESYVTRLYKNRFGEYFLYMGTDKSCVHFEHLTRERAMNSLRFNKKAFAKEFPGEH